VEVRSIVGRYILCVNCGVDEADRRLAVGHQLLVDQGNEAGPHGRREAGPAVVVCRASGLIGADVEGKVRVCRYVRAIAQGRGTLVAGVDHARELLPRGNRDGVRRNAAAAVGPCGFRLPGAARAGGCQVRAANGNDICIVRGPCFITRRPSRAVAGGRKEVLALRGHLFEVGVQRAGIRRRPAP
jgi:hypothetical protein